MPPGNGGHPGNNNAHNEQYSKGVQELQTGDVGDCPVGAQGNLGFRSQSLQYPGRLVEEDVQQIGIPGPLHQQADQSARFGVEEPAKDASSQHNPVDCEQRGQQKGGVYVREAIEESISREDAVECPGEKEEKDQGTQ